MSAVPEGWALVEIDDLIAPLEDGRTIHQGWSPQCEKSPSDSDAVWGVLKTTAIQPAGFLPEHNKRLPASREPRPVLEVRKGDVLVTSAGPRARCGVACAVRETRPRLMISGKMYRFRVNDQHVDPLYVEAFLQSGRAQLAIDEMKTGGSDSGLNLTQDRFRRLLVPLAPRAEQDRIVAAIEERVSRLDAATVALRIAERRSTMLTQRIVDEALEGDPESLGSLLREPLRNGLSAPAAADGSVRVVTLTAVTRSEFTDEHTKLIEPGSRSFDDLWMRPGDVFIQRSNTPELVGTSCMYRGKPRWAIFPDLLIRVRVGERVDPEYLELALRSARLRSYFQRSAQGIAGSMPKISQPIVAAAEIPLPAVRRQREIVDQVAKQLAGVLRLDAGLNVAKTRQRSLRRSILAAAFAGHLVLQDPNDEPASVLLERIRDERASADPKRRRRAAS